LPTDLVSCKVFDWLIKSLGESFQKKYGKQRHIDNPFPQRWHMDSGRVIVKAAQEHIGGDRAGVQDLQEMLCGRFDQFAVADDTRCVSTHWKWSQLPDLDF
jgi:hypothetical protein